MLDGAATLQVTRADSNMHEREGKRKRCVGGGRQTERGERQSIMEMRRNRRGKRERERGRREGEREERGGIPSLSH
jgi:hypothetical protein